MEPRRGLTSITDDVRRAVAATGVQEGLCTAIRSSPLKADDDRSAQVKGALTRTSESIPITGGELAFGTWQGVYV